MSTSKAPPSPPASSEKEAEFYRDVELGTIRTNPQIHYAEYEAIGEGLSSNARLTDDGRIVVSLKLTQALPELPQEYAPDVQEFAVDEENWREVPPMSIVIMIVGSRGDVQPYVALGRRLIEDGHRVRVATHETFRSFVLESGLEFFDIGGDPQALMSYMVKNPGLIPGFDSLTNGDIGRKRKMLAEMFNGCWRACHQPDDQSNIPFAADAIISNPPGFAHTHCAEAMGIPLLLTFTMPWTPTKAFAHPLVNVTKSNAEPGLTNFFTFILADLLMWQGVNDIVNLFRTKVLNLESLSNRSGAGLIDRLKIPWTYCISPALIEKPADWKNHIDTVGFYFLDLASSYEPPADLKAFLDKGPPPIYIGFGSVVVDDPKAMTELIFQATSQASVRVLLSAGWGGLGGMSVPDHVFLLGNVPHDWLFSRVSAVVHHGGAGTTAIGLRMGRPTVVVPFFGDQLFWGQMIENAGIGPAPIPHKEMTVDNLREAIKFTQSSRARNAAQAAAEKIKSENGVQKGVDSFYRHLPLLNMRCDLDPSRVAVWWSTKFCLKLSAFAAETLVNAKELSYKELDIHRTKEYETRKDISDPITGGGSAIFWTVTNWYTGIAQIFYQPTKGIVKTTKAIPAGVMDIILSIHEGLHNAPKLYGSDVRKKGDVSDFSSGLKEAGKGFFYGYYDGITGLVREPVQGAKKEGFLGAIKGSARSFVNVNMRPAAGAIGLVANPAQGAWKSLRKMWHSDARQPQRETRVYEGQQAVGGAAPGERERVVRAFEGMKGTVRERQEEYARAAREALEESGVMDGFGGKQGDK
ncbi:glycosyltransferase family 1 protein [Coniophora puteana RWD-64-598 SS2]|uniref:Glycosyltransferase family 1 protein n=1 Tax=Coniophora puteana (strain RWD-64-598) TaxID=741705 RepID=A0A5M3N3Y3_CONPW|nr:glycosyltransferase family 1 protein [Coniophora puteana RWD-64-598 SS2]EIW85621.1 glycosyltransferase family 1 protein [Coniophora puteana RWD-64-598 SS2]